jgi:hypothetical protein
MTKREELVKAVERTTDIWDGIWSKPQSKAFDDARDAWNDAKAALKAYDKENT